MNVNRKLIVLLALAASATLALAEVTVDFGATIRNSTGLESTGTASLAQSDKATAWIEVEGPRTTFLLRGGYTFSAARGEIASLVDVERLSLVSSVPGDGKPLSRFELSLGRRPVSDQTGYVLNRTLDGIAISASYPAATVSATVGTTFLPNKATAPVVLSRADAADLTSDEVWMGSPRVVGLLEVVFPSLLRQRLTLSLAMQEDLRPVLGTDALAGLFDARAGLIDEGTTTLDPSRGGLVDTQYASIGLRGNITGGLFYNGFFALNTGRTLSYLTDDQGASSYSYTPILAAAGGVGLSLYAEKVLGSVAGLRFVISSGDGWEERSSVNEGSTTATPGLFLPVTARPVSSVFAASLGNLAFTELSYSLRPFSGSGSTALSMLQVGATALVFVRPVAGPVSVALPNQASTSAYLGSELDLNVAFRPFSDLGIEASGGIFLPNAAPAGPFAGSAAWWRFDVAASMSF